MSRNIGGPICHYNAGLLFAGRFDSLLRLASSLVRCVRPDTNSEEDSRLLRTSQAVLSMCASAFQAFVEISRVHELGQGCRFWSLPIGQTWTAPFMDNKLQARPQIVAWEIKVFVRPLEGMSLRYESSFRMRGIGLVSGRRKRS